MFCGAPKKYKVDCREISFSNSNVLLITNNNNISLRKARTFTSKSSITCESSDYNILWNCSKGEFSLFGSELFQVFEINEDKNGKTNMQFKQVLEGKFIRSTAVVEGDFIAGTDHGDILRINWDDGVILGKQNIPKRLGLASTEYNLPVRKLCVREDSNIWCGLIGEDILVVSSLTSIPRRSEGTFSLAGNILMDSQADESFISGFDELDVEKIVSLQHIRCKGITAMELDHQGDVLACLMENGSVELFNKHLSKIDTLRVQHNGLSTHELGASKSLSWSSDGVLVVCYENGLCVWLVESRQLLWHDTGRLCPKPRFAKFCEVTRSLYVATGSSDNQPPLLIIIPCGQSMCQHSLFTPLVAVDDGLCSLEKSLHLEHSLKWKSLPTCPTLDSPMRSVVMSSDGRNRAILTDSSVYVLGAQKRRWSRVFQPEVSFKTAVWTKLEDDVIITNESHPRDYLALVSFSQPTASLKPPSTPNSSSNRRKSYVSATNLSGLASAMPTVAVSPISHEGGSTSTPLSRNLPHPSSSSSSPSKTKTLGLVRLLILDPNMLDTPVPLATALLNVPIPIGNGAEELGSWKWYLASDGPWVLLMAFTAQQELKCWLLHIKTHRLTWCPLDCTQSVEISIGPLFKPESVQLICDDSFARVLITEGGRVLGLSPIPLTEPQLHKEWLSDGMVLQLFEEDLQVISDPFVTGTTKLYCTRLDRILHELSSEYTNAEMNRFKSWLLMLGITSQGRWVMGTVDVLPHSSRAGVGFGPMNIPFAEGVVAGIDASLGSIVLAKSIQQVLSNPIDSSRPKLHNFLLDYQLLPFIPTLFGGLLSESCGIGKCVPGPLHLRLHLRIEMFDCSNGLVLGCADINFGDSVDAKLSFDGKTEENTKHKNSLEYASPVGGVIMKTAKEAMNLAKSCGEIWLVTSWRLQQGLSENSQADPLQVEQMSSQKILIKSVDFSNFHEELTSPMNELWNSEQESMNMEKRQKIYEEKRKEIEQRRQLRRKSLLSTKTNRVPRTINSSVSDVSMPVFESPQRLTFPNRRQSQQQQQNDNRTDDNNNINQPHHVTTPRDDEAPHHKTNGDGDFGVEDVDDFTQTPTQINMSSFLTSSCAPTQSSIASNINANKSNFNSFGVSSGRERSESVPGEPVQPFSLLDFNLNKVSPEYDDSLSFGWGDEPTPLIDLSPQSYNRQNTSLAKPVSPASYTRIEGPPMTPSVTSQMEGTRTPQSQDVNHKNEQESKHNDDNDDDIQEEEEAEEEELDIKIEDITIETAICPLINALSNDEIIESLLSTVLALRSSLSLKRVLQKACPELNEISCAFGQQTVAAWTSLLELGLKSQDKIWTKLDDSMKEHFGSESHEVLNCGNPTALSLASLTMLTSHNSGNESNKAMTSSTISKNLVNLDPEFIRSLKTTSDALRPVEREFWMAAISTIGHPMIIFLSLVNQQEYELAGNWLPLLQQWCDDELDTIHSSELLGICARHLANEIANFQKKLLLPRVCTDEKMDKNSEEAMSELLTQVQRFAESTSLAEEH